MFTKLPPTRLRNALREMFRVLRPGACSCSRFGQLAESPELEGVLRVSRGLPRAVFLRRYLEDDLAAILAELGFFAVTTEPHLVGRLVFARMPERSSPEA